MEVRSERVLKNDIDKSNHFNKIKQTAEYRKFLRSSKAAKIIEEADRELVGGGKETEYLHWDSTSRCKLGACLLSLVLQVAKVDVTAVDPKTGEKKQALAPAFFHTYELINSGKVGVVKLNHRFAEKLGKERLNQGLQLQYLPMICQPKPWTTHDDGGYLLKESMVMRTKHSIEQKAYVKAAAMQKRLDRVFSGLNSLGNTSWAVNKDILNVIIKVWNTGEEFMDIPPSIDELVLPPPPPKGTTGAERWKYRLECQAKTNEFSKHRSMRCDLNYRLEIARGLVGERLFFPHSVDYRGRAYPIPPNFNHLGNDVCRSLLVFWKGKKLGVDGLRWLKIHICNLFGKDKIPLSEREAFVNENIDRILESVEDPLNPNKKMMWREADKPWQFLAASIELSKALKLEDPTEYISHQPVHQDGTCNGLQHYAALGGDTVGAQQVNLIPAERPSDVYSHVAKSVEEYVAKDCAEGREEAILVKDIITRKLVKQTVMTSVYGVTYVGARAQISKRLKDIDYDETEIARVSKYLTDLVFKSIKQAFKGAHAIQDWFAFAAKMISKSVRLDPDQNVEVNFLSSVIWTTPLGLPVVQPYREIKSKAVTTSVQNIMISDPYEIKKVDARKQASGFPPNFVHSLDATHMLMSVNECASRGLMFASVHDSYWTHACDVTTMSAILREQFVALHTKNLVARLKREFEVRYKDLLMEINVTASDPAYIAVQKAKEEMAAKFGRKITTKDEILAEFERRRLLSSGDPFKIKQAKQMVTTISVLEDMNYSVDFEKLNTGSSHGPRILVPFQLPDIPERGEFDVNVVKDSTYFFS
ncbi:unnamed protein product [Ambrosiozyma monospora]|uniref:Unnamed protein product n=1 Tax=Ambrosiozyma monospora TaxID=43982 RepID=A0ACB5T521_AMBMO|nr:unnamed protein product [Ambrosiozyma monospora]